MSIHVTNHTNGTKMAGIQSISTSCLCNPICQKRMQEAGSICSHCYASHLCGFRKSLQKNLAENYQELTTRLLTKREAAAVPVTSLIARIESFGDVGNVIQARNNLRIIRAHSYIKFGIWSKNWRIWLQAFQQEKGKPRNCTYVHSSRYVNEIADVPEAMKPYIDHVFTVWDKEHYVYAGTKSECAGLSCAQCQKCYRKGGSFYIDEKLR